MKNIQVLPSMHQTERLWPTCVNTCNVCSLFMGITQFKGHSSHWDIHWLKKSQTPAKKILQFVMFFITQLLGLRKLSDRLGNSCNCFSQLDHNLRAEVFDNVAMNILYIFLVPQKLRHFLAVIVLTCSLKCQFHVT